MPRLLDIEVSGASLALRVVLGVVFGGISFVVFYYLPANLGNFLSSALPAASRAAAAGVASALINPSLPLIGLAAAALVFLGFLLRGTKAYGLILVLNGIVFLAYVYTAFQGGTITLNLPAGLPSSASGNISLNASNLMLLFLLAPLLTVVKGIVLTVMKPQVAQQQTG